MMLLLFLCISCSLRALQQAGGGLDSRYIHICLGEIPSRKRKHLVIVISRFILSLRDLKRRDCPCLARSCGRVCESCGVCQGQERGEFQTGGNCADGLQPHHHEDM